MTRMIDERAAFYLCLRKVVLPTRSEAKRALSGMRKKHPGESFDMYRCPIDRAHFHVGHPR